MTLLGKSAEQKPEGGFFKACLDANETDRQRRHRKVVHTNGKSNDTPSPPPSREP